MTGYCPDATIAINTAYGPAIVHLAKGGEQFPWAVHNGKVVTGPLTGRTPDGLSFDDLEWRVDEYWVIDAFDQDGEPIELTPFEYLEAITKTRARKVRSP